MRAGVAQDQPSGKEICGVKDMELNLNEIFHVIDKVQQAGLASFSYRDADTKLHIKMQNTADRADAAGVKGMDGDAAGAKGADSDAADQAGTDSNAGTKGADSNAADKAGRDIEENMVYIESPMVGTFYAAPSADKAPFVSVGDTVRKGQVVAIIEAMKLMNEVEAERGGIVEEILARNEQLVEFGQPLFRLRAADGESE